MAKTMFDLLEGALEDLGAEKFKKFISKMTDPGLETRVAKGAVEEKDCGDIANLLIEHFTESRALEITLQIMRNIKANQTAENLEKDAAAHGFLPSAGSVSPVLFTDCPDPQAPVQNVPPPQGPAVTTGASAAGYVMPKTSGTLIPSSPKFKQDIISKKGQEIYPVLDKGVRKRLALMINNVEFDSGDKRFGAEIDEKNMEKLLKALGYDVVKYNDLSATEMDEAIRSFAGRSEHAESDSTFVVIMSHGERDKLFGIGQQNPNDFLHVDKIFKHLNTANCPALLHKPKVILIQACRGGDNGKLWVALSVTVGMYSLDSDASEHKEKDFVTLFLCTPDNVSYRNEKYGSYLIGFLVEVFNENAHKEHIEELFRLVMRRFENFMRITQMPSKERVSLPKLFYLFPGL
ncbi:caspase a-like [Astyanax mexicanus]|uniref:caspase a-like n=1 Tax=Astyanax mexicanus TaxID=7994 RepID=UPI0020CAACF7|nr:caspase a-like [Astyanax mexicanus]